MSADGIAARLALYQAAHRIMDRFTPQKCEALILAIDKREDSPDKLHRFQAVELVARQRYKVLYETYGHDGAYLAGYWATTAQYRSEGVWRRLYGGPNFVNDRSSYAKVPGPDDYAATLTDFMNDSELMDILDLPAGPPDLKRINPDLDLKATDQGGLS